jgi:hypothetical protein
VIARAAPRTGSGPSQHAHVSRELKLLVEHREDVVANRTRPQNRLRWHLHAVDSELHPGQPEVGDVCCLQGAVEQAQDAGPGRPDAAIGMPGHALISA